MSTVSPQHRGGIFVDTWSNVKRNVLVSLRNPYIVAFSLFQPVIWLVLFSEIFSSIARIPGFSTDSYIAFLAPGILVMVVLFDSMSSGIGLVENMRAGVFTKLLATPMHRGAIFLGKTLAETLRSVVVVVLVLSIALVLGARVETGLLGVGGIIGVSILFGLGFVALSNILALVTRNAEATTIGTQFIGLPLVFLSSAFMPFDLLPAWVRIVSRVNPITYAVDAIRTVMLRGWDWGVLGPSLAALVVFDLVLGAIALVLMKRATEATPR